MPNNMPFNSRELSWLDFNERVLEEAVKKSNPLMERIKFLSITSSNLDEFFMVRVSGIKDEISNGIKRKDDSGLTPQKLLIKVEAKSHTFMDKQYNCFNRSLIPALKKEGIEFLSYAKTSSTQKKQIADYFEKVIFPVLTPLAIDNSRPFPVLANKTLNIAIKLEEKENKNEACFSVVQVPSILPRFLQLTNKKNDELVFILLEEIIISKLNHFFDLHNIVSTALFRITRNADMEIDEEAEDYLWEVEKSIKKRKRGKPVRLELSAKADKDIKEFLFKNLHVDEKDIYECHGPLDFTFLTKFSGVSHTESHYFSPITPVSPAVDFFDSTNIFDTIKEKDRMVHHPYESFDCVVNFIESAANDPNVLAIKQTLYRVSGNSPIIAALMKAAENGKQVTVLVELKARFDEENNIIWAKKLEKAGCHVIYGLFRLKTHCKIALVVRKEDDGIRRYVHMGTGNYNDSTARFYTDISMFTCNERYGVDASSLFNVLTGYSSSPMYNHFVVAPYDMRKFFVRMIRAEVENAKNGLPSGINIKVNSLIDAEITNELYKASNAGVPIKLIVRGVCGLIPQLEGLSENITVISIIGQLLEHSRIFIFENCGDTKVYLGSADWMPRNLDRRVELVFPVKDKDLIERVLDIFAAMENDNTNARIMNSDTTYTSIDKRGKVKQNSQQNFSKEANNKLSKLKEFNENSTLIPIHSAE